MREVGSDFKQREPQESVFTFLGSDHNGLSQLIRISSILLICIFLTSFRLGIQAFSAFIFIVCWELDLLGGWKIFSVGLNINAKFS